MTNLTQTISAGPAPEAARGLLSAANLPTSDLTDEPAARLIERPDT
jgi:hypothetical protein